MEKPTSQKIGATHEQAVRDLLDNWSVRYVKKKRVRTSFDSDVELDFFLPLTQNRPPVVLECKNFAVCAKNPEDSKRRKTQEALWLLLQVKKYCPETRDTRLILITGKIGFRADQEALLRSELGDDFHIVSIVETSRLQHLVAGVTQQA